MLVLTKPLGVGVLNFSRQIGRDGGDEQAQVTFPAPELPTTAISFVVRPKSKGDEEKVATKKQAATGDAGG